MTGYAQGAHDNADDWRDRAKQAEADRDKWKGLYEEARERLYALDT